MDLRRYKSDTQAFGHSGIGAFRHSGIQTLGHSGIQALRHLVVVRIDY
jgi:hypothetical protein